jgi:putative alpha-1,2-mannosidase
MYVVGTPFFPKMTMRLDGGKELTIIAHNISNKNIYIQSVSLNGKHITGSFLSHKDITQGGTLEFVMGPRPPK